MEMEMAGSILAPTLFVLKLPVALARAPGKTTYGSGRRVENFTLCVGPWLMQHERVGISLLEEARITNNGACNAKAALVIRCYRI